MATVVERALDSLDAVMRLDPSQFGWQLSAEARGEWVATSRRLREWLDEVDRNVVWPELPVRQ
jgi:hypothetical protein